MKLYMWSKEKKNESLKGQLSFMATGTENISKRTACDTKFATLYSSFYIITLTTSNKPFCDDFNIHENWLKEDWICQLYFRNTDTVPTLILPIMGNVYMYVMDH